MRRIAIVTAAALSIVLSLVVAPFAIDCAALGWMQAPLPYVFSLLPGLLLAGLALGRYWRLLAGERANGAIELPQAGRFIASGGVALLAAGMLLAGIMDWRWSVRPGNHLGLAQSKGSVWVLRGDSDKVTSGLETVKARQLREVTYWTPKLIVAFALVKVLVVPLWIPASILLLVAVELVISCWKTPPASSARCAPASCAVLG